MGGFENFIAVMGPPAPAVPPGLRFKDAGQEFIWENMHAIIGSGWYQSRFFYLFGEGLEELRPCLEAWSFLVPPGPERMILGRNAYGALLVYDNPDRPGAAARVRILNPVDVSWYRNPLIDFGGLVGHWFPNRSLPPAFLDKRIYEEWLQRSGRYLEPDEVLAIKVPLSLGGRMELDNFQVENIVKYYRTTGPIYAKAQQGQAP